MNPSTVHRIPVRRARVSPDPERRGRLLAVAAAAVGVVAAVADASPAFAQSCGGCAGPGVSGGGGSQRSWLEEGGATIRLSYEYEVKDRSYDGRDRVVNDFDEVLRANRLAADIKFGVTDEWTAALGIHHPRFQYRLKPPGGARSEQTFRGPGDTTLLFGRMFALRDENLDAATELARVLDPLGDHQGSARTVAGPTLQVWLGFSIPTGQAEEPNPAFVTRDVSISNLQTGTGTWDPMLRLRFDDPSPRVRPFVQADVRWPVTENRYDYRTGRAASLTAGAETDILPPTDPGRPSRLRANLSATFLRVERDRFDGDRVGVGGGKWLYLTPGLAFDVSDTVTLDLSARLTAWRDTQTKLSDGPLALQAGVTFRF